VLEDVVAKVIGEAIIELAYGNCWLLLGLVVRCNIAAIALPSRYSCNDLWDR